MEHSANKKLNKFNFLLALCRVQVKNSRFATIFYLN